jgi:hypothetical protein
MPSLGSTRITCWASIILLLAQAIADEGYASEQSRGLTVKSFIRTIRKEECASATENLFRCATNFAVAENPTTPARDTGDYRLLTKVDIVADCDGNRVVSWRVGPLQTSVGKEGPLEAKGRVGAPLKVSPERGPAAKVAFQYTFMGQPNPATWAGFRIVGPRTCSWIWHEVQGALTCADGKLQLIPSLYGSRFPSHRIWVDQQVVQTIDQEKLQALWECSTTDPELVR